ncbi:unnamed protein product [Ranitomeya imitator]|uniref:NADH dehydrogenase subunit 1 n=1 Tax=Ranitomeya imitator TaxID=111125 RepID=A0ABN9L800_9NEOB|nr:unnamed protein product [Ranitomeya imitator]
MLVFIAAVIFCVTTVGSPTICLITTATPLAMKSLSF